MLSFLSSLISHPAEAAVSSGTSSELSAKEVSAGGGGSTSSQTFGQTSTVGGALSSSRVTSTNFEVIPGFLGGLSGGLGGAVPIVGQLDITVLFAKTEPMGSEISAETWQLDVDPVFYWEPPAEGLDLAGYSYAIDGMPDAEVDTTATNFDVKTQHPAPFGDGTHTFTVQAVNSAGTSGEPISFEIWVDTTPPTITGYGPAPGTLLNTATPSITANVTDAGSGVSGTSVDMRINGSTVPTLFDPVSGVVSTSWAGAFHEGPNSLELTVGDIIGNTLAPLLWTVTIDTVPPSGTITINADAIMTTSLYVTLGFTATDATSGVVGLRLSNQPLSGYVQEPFAAVRELWALGAVAGEQTVYVKFVDAAGNESQPFFDDIELILLSPETVITSGPAGFTMKPVAEFGFMCPEGGCVFSYAFDNDAWSDWDSGTEASIVNLRIGNHYFRVKAAKEINGVEDIQPEEEDPSPAERTWIVTIETPPLAIPFGPPIKLWRIE